MEASPFRPRHPRADDPTPVGYDYFFHPVLGTVWTGHDYRHPRACNDYYSLR